MTLSVHSRATQVLRDGSTFRSGNLPAFALGICFCLSRHLDLVETAVVEGAHSKYFVEYISRS